MVIDINDKTFKTVIFDYSKGTEWKFNGDKPAIIYFYAVWCNPCKMMTPGVEELSEEYDGKVDFYKVNLDTNVMLVKEFQITNIPSILFIAMNRMPEMAVGALPKKDIEEAIKRIL